MLSPAKQPINEITVDTENEESIHDSLKKYCAEVAWGKDDFKVFDPKEHLLPFKNKALPATLLTAPEVKQAA
jgi:hypothetical protein